MGLQYLSEESSAPTSPASGQVVLYPKTDHFLYWKDSAGTVHTVIHTTGTLTSGRVPYVTTGGALTDSANFAYDGTTFALASALNYGGVTLSNAVTGTGNMVLSAAPTISGVPVFSGVPSLTGGAVHFPATQVPSADANDLDDYEEGTFTPSIGGSSTLGTQTYAVRSGFYTKIGNRVFYNLRIALSAVDAARSGNAIINSLPFTANTAVNAHCPSALDELKQITYTAILTGRIEPSQTAINLVDTNGSASTPAYLQASAITATTTINAQGHYFI